MLGLAKGRLQREARGREKVGDIYWPFHLCLAMVLGPLRSRGWWQPFFLGPNSDWVPITALPLPSTSWGRHHSLETLLTPCKRPLG